MNNTKRLGSITELKVMAELLRFGEVSIPYGNNARYDCVLEINGVFKKIQIKTAHKVDENRFSVPFANTHCNYSGNLRKTYTVEDVDYIATYYSNQLYLFPVGNHSNMMMISFEYPSNGLKKKINLAENYKVENILSNLLSLD